MSYVERGCVRRELSAKTTASSRSRFSLEFQVKKTKATRSTARLTRRAPNGDSVKPRLRAQVPSLRRSVNFKSNFLAIYVIILGPGLPAAQLRRRRMEPNKFNGVSAAPRSQKTGRLASTGLRERFVRRDANGKQQRQTANEKRRAARKRRSANKRDAGNEKKTRTKSGSRTPKKDDAKNVAKKATQKRTRNRKTRTKNVVR